MTDLASE